MEVAPAVRRVTIAVQREEPAGAESKRITCREPACDCGKGERLSWSPPTRSQK